MTDKQKAQRLLEIEKQMRALANEAFTLAPDMVDFPDLPEGHQGPSLKELIDESSGQLRHYLRLGAKELMR